MLFNFRFSVCDGHTQIWAVQLGVSPLFPSWISLLESPAGFISFVVKTLKLLLVVVECDSLLKGIIRH